MKILYSIARLLLVLVCGMHCWTCSYAQHNGIVVDVDIPWTSAGQHLVNVDGAIYPEEYHGFPAISILPNEQSIDHVRLLRFSESPFPEALQQQIGKSFPAGLPMVSLDRKYDRGKAQVRLNVFPMRYDSTSGKFFRIDHLQLQLQKMPQNPWKANLRSSSGTAVSVLASGEWYKIPVTTPGVYKIDYDYLKNAGVSPSGLDPRKIRLFGNGGGMLPQLNSAPRPDDLTENAIMVVGEGDGIFDKEDYVLFYGQGPDDLLMNEQGGLDYQKNFYSDTTFYFLNIGADDGMRIADRASLGTNQPKISSFDDYIVYEKDEHNIINSGREWLGEKFDFTLTYDFKFDFDHLVPDTPITIKTSVLGQTYQEAGLDIYVNGQKIGTQTINAISQGSYVSKGSMQQEIFNSNSSQIPAGDPFTVRMSFQPAGTGMSKASLNYLIIQARRQLLMFSPQVIFRSLASLQNAISTFQVQGGTEINMIWDVTNPLQPVNQSFSMEGGRTSFGALSDQLLTYVAFKGESYLAPGTARTVKNQNLHGTPNVDFLIITCPAFWDEAQRLADLRSSHDKLRVAVVTVDEIYNEYSSGKQDVSAIRDFIKSVYDKGSQGARLQNVLLFGKGSFDYKDRIEHNTNFVPIYTSRNSVHPINSYSSDDYYGFMDDNEGIWQESYSGDHVMDIGVGRLPVKTAEEARVVVDKLIHYTTSNDTYGSWRNEIFFIADDGDGNLHQRDADRLATLVDTTATQMNVNKIYVDAYPQVQTSIGESAPEVNAEIGRSIDKGGLIFNFTGHGSTTRWTSETILNISSISEFENTNRLPLVVTATCEFGRHDNPIIVSGAEHLLLNPKGGAIGLVTTARPVFSSTNFILNKAFYQTVFKRENNQNLSLGEIFRRTKNLSLNGSVNRNFSLLADPSMTLAYAKRDIKLLADGATYSPDDTLRALSAVQFSGQVINTQGDIDTGFNGPAFVTVFDRPVEKLTLGHEDAPMKYQVRDNILFKGKVSVKNGEFSINFVVPENISYDLQQGKMSLYAEDMSKPVDAAGSDFSFVVGGNDANPTPDNTPPDISLFINDTTFVNGGITGTDIVLLAGLYDEHGINTTTLSGAHQMRLILDDSLTEVVSKYYLSDEDSYQSGWVTYPIKNLSIGTHKIRLLVQDVYNNEGEAEIEFNVLQDRQLTIDKLMNFPNPFREFTRFSFEHNRAGDDLEIDINVYSMQGKLVKHLYYLEKNSNSRIADIVWDRTQENGSNMLNGVYIFRISVRSLMDGSKNQANQKLVIIY